MDHLLGNSTAEGLVKAKLPLLPVWWASRSLGADPPLFLGFLLSGNWMPCPPVSLSGFLVKIATSSLSETENSVLHSPNVSEIPPPRS